MFWFPPYLALRNTWRFEILGASKYLALRNTWRFEILGASKVARGIPSQRRFLTSFSLAHGLGRRRLDWSRRSVRHDGGRQDRPRAISRRSTGSDRPHR